MACPFCSFTCLTKAILTVHRKSKHPGQRFNRIKETESMATSEAESEHSCSSTQTVAYETPKKRKYRRKALDACSKEAAVRSALSRDAVVLLDRLEGVQRGRGGRGSGRKAGGSVVEQEAAVSAAADTASVCSGSTGGLMEDEDEVYIEDFVEEVYKYDLPYQDKLLDLITSAETYNFLCPVRECRQQIVPQSKSGVLCHLQHHSLNYFCRVCCQLCSYKADTEEAILRHCSVAHAHLPHYFCYYCPFRSQSAPLAREHAKHHHPNYRRHAKYKCTQCSYQGKLQEDMERHRRCHSTRGKPAKKGAAVGGKPKKGGGGWRWDEWLVCDKCPFRVAPECDWELEEHGHHHEPENNYPHKCSLCDYGSHTMSDMNTHRDLHFTPSAILNGRSSKASKARACKIHESQTCEARPWVMHEYDTAAGNISKPAGVDPISAAAHTLRCDYCDRRYHVKDKMAYLRHEANHLLTGADIKTSMPYLYP